MQKDLLFVEHSAGEFEGTVYDNVILSDGIRAVKVKNLTGKTSDYFRQLGEGDKVVCTLDVTTGKMGFVVTLKGIEKKK